MELDGRDAETDDSRGEEEREAQAGGSETGVAGAVGGLRTPAPAMTELLLALLVLALIGRNLPQINVLAVGFGINTLVALATLLLSLGAIVWAFQEQIEPVLDLIQTTLTSGGR